ncbi:hypothetical protein M747DRAFT_326829 [Aspergillus niger ATCC 13496]|uniref:Uncharacterized protein n=1 Tax=Aspergillus niger ATCC 13496 TaxID=1353008 RepID=A0A370BFQ5_ASPNG|nr:hypothetical protein M747DRAFT_326829 [Aspergillus niger ATCC 13496]
MESPPPRNLVWVAARTAEARSGSRIEDGDWRNRVSARAERRKREREVTQSRRIWDNWNGGEANEAGRRPMSGAAGQTRFWKGTGVGPQTCDEVALLPIRPDSSDNRLVSMPRQEAEEKKSLNFAQTLGAGGAPRPTIISISDDFGRNPFKTHWLRFLANGGGMDAAAAVGDGRRIDFFLAACASLVKVDRSDCKSELPVWALDWVRGKTAALGQDRRRLRRDCKKFPNKFGGETSRHISTLIPVGSWYTILGFVMFKFQWTGKGVGPGPDPLNLQTRPRGECSYSLPDRIDQLSPPQYLLRSGSSSLRMQRGKKGKKSEEAPAILGARAWGFCLLYTEHVPELQSAYSRPGALSAAEQAEKQAGRHMLATLLRLTCRNASFM